MNASTKILKRIRLLSFKLKGQLPYLTWAELIAQCIRRDFKLQRLIKKIDNDPTHRISLYSVPGYKQALWLPDADPEMLEVDANLALCDLYHCMRMNHIINKGDVVLDCGGYVGLFALWALNQKASKIIVFEPLKKNIECIKRNLSDHINAGKVILVEAGVWNRKGYVEFFEDEGGSASTFVKEMVYEKTPGWRNIHLERIHSRIPVVTIDHIAEELNLPSIDLIKMDVEGAEPEAISGAKNTLVKYFPSLAVCTYHRKNHHDLIYSSVIKENPLYRNCVTNRGSLITCWSKYGM